MAVRGKERKDWLNNFPYLKHLGIYAYRKEVLKEVTQLPQSSLEILVVGAGHHRLTAKSLHGIEDALVVGSHVGFLQDGCYFLINVR